MSARRAMQGRGDSGDAETRGGRSTAAAPAWGAWGRAGGIADPARSGGVGDAVDVGDGKAIEFGADGGGGFEFLVAQFGDLMERVPQVGQTRQHLSDGGVGVHDGRSISK